MSRPDVTADPAPRPETPAAPASPARGSRLATVLRGAPAAIRRWVTEHRDRLTRGVLIANLVAQIGIVVTGGAVRLTGSGLGCSTWPQCEPGHFTPKFHEATSIHPYIEFGNRTLTGVLGIIAIVVALLVWTDRRRSPAFRWLGFAPIIGVVAQAVIGGVTVLLDLHPAVVSTHFLVSMGLVIASALLLHRSTEGDGTPQPVVDPLARRLVPVMWAVLAVLLALGAITTGAGPHSGDDEVGYRFAVDPLLMARVHALAAWAFIAVLVWLLVLNRRHTGPVRSRGIAMLVIVALQGVIGYVQVATDLPVLLVLLHMLGAGLLAAGTTRYLLTFRTRA